MGTNTAIILTILSLVIFVAILIYIAARKPLKLHTYQEYQNDELISIKKTPTSKNFLYFTHGQTLSYIKKYIVCKTKNDQFVVCKFTKEFKSIDYYIVSFDEHKKPISVIKCHEKDTQNSSHVVPLPKNAKYVNVIIGKAEDNLINSSVVRPIPLKVIKKYSLLRSLSFLTGTFSLMNLIIFILGNPYYRYIINVPDYLIYIGVLVLLSIILFFVRYITLRKRNVKSRLGGVVDYEFI